MIVIPFSNGAPGKSPGGVPSEATYGLAVAGLLGQVGCLTVAIVLGALGTGLWLDAQLGSRPLFTIGLILASVPLTLVLMFRIVLAGARRLRSKSAPGPEGHTGEGS
ncbi:MAG: AtpZ/AtpI family protein [Anaerolineales bacterium]